MFTFMFYYDGTIYTREIEPESTVVMPITETRTTSLLDGRRMAGAPTMTGVCYVDDSCSHVPCLWVDIYL